MRTLRVTGFAALSVAAHAALLAIPLGAPHENPSPQMTIEVSLIPGIQTATTNEAPPRESHQQIRHDNNTKVRALKPAPTTLVDTNSELQSNAFTAVQTPPEALNIAALIDAHEKYSDADEAQLERARAVSEPQNIDLTFALVISYLRDVIEHRKAYPLLAKQRGWEGEVLLAFRVVDDGAIQSVHVARSSGNQLLDQSAVYALQNVERVKPSLWRDGDNADLQLSVIYRLVKI